MIDLTPIKDWIIEENETYINEANAAIINIGFDSWFDNQLENWLDCSKLSKDNHRILQTNDKRYNYELTTTLYMIEKYGKENLDYYHTRLLDKHNNNLKFEEINGLEYSPYGFIKSNKAKTSNKKRNKQTSLNFSNEEKESIKDLKHKAHMTKINKLTIKLNPVNYGNNIV